MGICKKYNFLTIVSVNIVALRNDISYGYSNGASVQRLDRDHGTQKRLLQRNVHRLDQVVLLPRELVVGPFLYNENYVRCNVLN